MDIVIGHEENKEKLKKMIESNQIGHAYLFVGKKSIGKKLFAVEFAKSILCDSSVNGKYCDKCESCLTFEHNSDFKIIAPEKDAIKVDTIRKMTGEIILMPTKSKRKVFIIDDAELMNEQAQNALLKILEEPPKYATIILITSNKDKLLNTIKSRVMEIQFNALSNDEIKKILAGDVHEEALKFANGSVSKALDFNNDMFLMANSIATVMKTKNFLVINRKMEELKNDKKYKSMISDVLEKVMFIFYSELKENVEFDVNMISYIEECLQSIKRNGNVDLALDMLLLNVCNL